MPVLLAFPALNEENHVVRLAEFSRQVLRARLVDEAVLLDGGSTDGTTAACATAGLDVLSAQDLPGGQEVRGKGDSVRRLLAARPDHDIVLVDADVVGLPIAGVGQLVDTLQQDGVVLVKGVCRRRGPDGSHREGRVSSLIARPALRLLGTGLEVLEDPLSGQVALRSGSIPTEDIADGYGLEISMLLSVARRHGAGAVRQVDLGTIEHGHKDVEELEPVARDVLAVLLANAPVQQPGSAARAEVTTP